MRGKRKTLARQKGCLFLRFTWPKVKARFERALVRAKGRKIIQTEVYAARIQNVECPPVETFVQKAFGLKL